MTYIRIQMYKLRAKGSNFLKTNKNQLKAPDTRGSITQSWNHKPSFSCCWEIKKEQLGVTFQLTRTLEVSYPAFSRLATQLASLNTQIYIYKPDLVKTLCKHKTHIFQFKPRTFKRKSIGRSNSRRKAKTDQYSSRYIRIWSYITMQDEI